MLRAFAKTEKQAKTDPLTGLLNRRSLEAAAQGLIDNNETYLAAYADLDHFKILNDVHGHDAGDRALKLFARVYRDNVRPSDIPARYGGEEFVVVLPNCELGDAMLVMDRVRDRLAAGIHSGQGPSSPSASVWPNRPSPTPSAKRSTQPTPHCCSPRPAVVIRSSSRAGRTWSFPTIPAASSTPNRTPRRRHHP